MEPNSKKLATLLTSLVSQLLLLLLLLFPSHSLPNSTDFLSLFPSNSQETISLLIAHLLSTHQIVTSLSLLTPSKKRKRTHFSGPNSEPTHVETQSQLGTRLSELLRVTRNPDSFKTFFNMRSSTFEWLSGLLEPLLECRDPIGTPINLSAELRLGIGLFRLATGSGYQEIATRFGVTESVSRFCAKQLCRVLCTNFRFWVAFPSSNELELISKEFEALIGLPNCCGVIACKRFKLVKKIDANLEPNDNVLDDVISVQVVVDSSSRILSVVAGFRGDKKEDKILKSSTLCKDIEEGRLLNSNPVVIDGVEVNPYLLGVGRYPLLPWLMLPFVDAVKGTREDKFNELSDLASGLVRKTIACLGNWRVLCRPIEEEFKTAVAFIGACSMLHNVLLMRDGDDASVMSVRDCPLDDQGRSSDTSLGDYMVEEEAVGTKASEIRNALAKRLTESQDI